MRFIPRNMSGIFASIIAVFLFITSFPGVGYAYNKQAVFAGGCFWCLEHDLEALEGVTSVESGYSGGRLNNPNYQNHTGHQESVIVNYDPEKITYRKLLRYYLRNIDPFDGEGQFCDRGDSYKPVIFIGNGDQKEFATESIQLAAKELGQPIERLKIEVLPLTKFWLAEDYHQDFAERNALKYNFYRYSCGRDARLKEVWGSKATKGSDWGE